MNALITLAWHITKKDLRASRDLIIGGVLLVIAATLLRTVWPPMTMWLDPRVTEWVNLLENPLTVMHTLVAALLVVQVVQADPLAGDEGFWLTRPIPRRTLFISKLATIALAVVMPTLVGQVVPMLAFGAPLFDVTRLLSEYLLYFAAGLMAVFAGAALTRNVRAFVSWSAGLGLLWAVITISTMRVSTSMQPVPGTTQSGATVRQPRQSPQSRQSMMPSPTGLIVVFVVMSAGSTAVAWHQFRTRRTARSALIGAITIVAVLGLPRQFPPVVIEASGTFTDDPAMPLGSGMRFKEGARSVVMWPLGESRGECGVMVRVTQIPGNRPLNAPPAVSYRFVHRPTGRPLVFTYFALPDRIRERPSEQSVIDYGAAELFQISYRYAVVGPMFASTDPRSSELRAVSCRDVDVVIRH